MDTLSLTLDVAGVHSLYILPKSTVTVKLLEFAIQQHRKYTLMSSAGMLPDLSALFIESDFGFRHLVLSD